MKIHVLTAVWKRPHITRIFLENMLYLKTACNGVEIDLTAVGSEGEISKQLIEQYGFHYVETDNKPLGKKWNKGLKAAAKQEWNYLLILGSDDLISPNLLQVYYNEINKGYRYIGLKDFYVYDTINHQLSFWAGYAKGHARYGETIGGGRLVSRKILEKLHFKLWTDEKNIGLDRGANERILKHKPKQKKLSHKTHPVFLLDLKSDTNLGNFNKYDELRHNAADLLPKHLPHMSHRYNLNLIVK